MTSRFRYPHSSPYRRLVREIVGHNVPRCGATSVLDFGFGHGLALFWFKPPTRIYGIELSSLAIQNAIRKAAFKKYTVYEFKAPLRSDSTRIDYPNGCFDVIISSHTLEHVYDDEGLMREFIRVLKPSGKLFLIVPKDANNEALLENKRGRMNPKYPQESYHVWCFNAITIRYLAEQAGFRVLKVECFDSIMEKIKTRSRFTQLIYSAITSVGPYRLWEHLDRIAHAQGYVQKQVVMVAEKPSDDF